MGAFGEEIMKNHKVNISLITLAVTSALSSTAHAAQSETASAKQTIDEQIIVTASRSEQERFTALSSTEVILSEQITQMQAANITEVLNTIAGISVVNQGGAGQSAGVFMRGANSNHTLILIDGVRTNSATLGTTNLSAISPTQIERIEVVKGPRAALWGSDALGGVIQIFTKQYTNGEGQLSVGAGSNGYIKGAGSIGLGNETSNITVSLSSEQSDGFNAYQTDDLPYDINEPDEDGFDRISASLVGNTQLSNTLALQLVGRYESGNSEFDASYPDSPCWDDPSQACPAFYANEQDHENYSVKFASTYQGDNLTSELALSTFQDQAETFGNGLTKDEITTERDQVSFINEYSYSANGSVLLGLDYYNEQVSTNTDKDPWNPGFDTWAVDERDVSAVFLQARQSINKWLLEAAVRYDDIEEVGDETTYNTSIGYQITDDFLVSVNHGTGFKAPTFNDLYWPGSGNENLVPEELTNTEVLARYRFNSDDMQGNVEISVFDSEIDNLIAWAPNDFGLWQPSNINSAEISGVEAAIDVSYGNFTHLLNASFIDAVDSQTDKQLLRRPELTAAYGLTYFWNDFSFNALVTYRDESLDSGDVTLDSYVLVDFAIAYQATSNLELNFKANNVFDEEYETSLNYVADGSNFKASATYSF